MAATALTQAWSRGARHSPAEVERLRTEVGLLREELDLKDARFARVPARRRPHYGPAQRMRILELRAARGWSARQVAERFLVSEETIANWMRRLDEEGKAGLVRLDEPVNRFPDLVGHLVRRLRALCPALGKARIAQVLARAGLHLGVTTVGRMLEREPTRPIDDEEAPIVVVNERRQVRAKKPHDVWHLDLTAVPTAAGFWTSWIPFSKPLRWPFGWWVAVVVDQVSRLAVGFAVFKRRPTTAEVVAFLARAMHRAKARPRTIVTDKGSEFGWAFRHWCRRRGIGHCSGAVGEHASIAIVERFIRSMKAECIARLLLVPFELAKMRYELACYASWYNEYRPHTSLGGRTPLEVLHGLPAANPLPRLEPRQHWPPRARCAAPNVPIRGKRGARIELVVSRYAGRKHLPVVEIRRAG